MKITEQVSDARVLRELGARLAAERLAQDLTQAHLAEQAGISKRTLERLESGAVATQLSTFLRVLRVLGLQDKLEALIPEPVPSPIEQLKRKGRTRQRASGQAAPDATHRKKWTWET
ncbi:MAG: helix-turn-helix transcriptional regulator [Rhodanobacteraceae bacterium]